MNLPWSSKKWDNSCAKVKRILFRSSSGNKVISFKWKDAMPSTAWFEWSLRLIFSPEIDAAILSRSIVLSVCPTLAMTRDEKSSICSCVMYGTSESSLLLSLKMFSIRSLPDSIPWSRSSMKSQSELVARFGDSKTKSNNFPLALSRDNDVSISEVTYWSVEVAFADGDRISSHFSSCGSVNLASPIPLDFAYFLAPLWNEFVVTRIAFEFADATCYLLAWNSSSSSTFTELP